MTVPVSADRVWESVEPSMGKLSGNESQDAAAVALRGVGEGRIGRSGLELRTIYRVWRGWQRCLLRLFSVWRQNVDQRQQLVKGIRWWWWRSEEARRSQTKEE